jgi:hypothetical protein
MVANCAWDVYAIPAALGAEDALIDTDCPDCGEVIRLEVRAGKRVRRRSRPLPGAGIQVVDEHRFT